MRLNQATVHANDVQAAADFYRRLGLRLIVDARPRYVRFECPDGDSTFSVEHTDEPISNNGPVIYFECDDLDARVGALRSQGVVFEVGPVDQPWLWRETRLKDPAGNEIRLYRAGENRRNPPWRVRDDLDAQA